MQIEYRGQEFIMSMAKMAGEILDRKLLKPRDLQRLAANLLSPSAIADSCAEVTKEHLERQVQALADMSAPKTDMVISEPMYPEEHPKNEIKVPPYGTLDKQATLDLLVKIARIELVNDTRTDGGFDDSAVKLAKSAKEGLPELWPGIFEPGDVAKIKSEIPAYVEKMNKEPNSLGRDFIHARDKMEYRPGSLLQKYAAACARLQAAAEQP